MKDFPTQARDEISAAAQALIDTKSGADATETFVRIAEEVFGAKVNAEMKAELARQADIAALWRAQRFEKKEDIPFVLEAIAILGAVTEPQPTSRSMLIWFWMFGCGCRPGGSPPSTPSKPTTNGVCDRLRADYTNDKRNLEKAEKDLDDCVARNGGPSQPPQLFQTSPGNTGGAGDPCASVRRRLGLMMSKFESAVDALLTGECAFPSDWND